MFDKESFNIPTLTSKNYEITYLVLAKEVLEEQLNVNDNERLNSYNKVALDLINRAIITIESRNRNITVN